jgi:hypothetical protein
LQADSLFDDACKARRCKGIRPGIAVQVRHGCLGQGMGNRRVRGSETPGLAVGQTPLGNEGAIGPGALKFRARGPFIQPNGIHAEDLAQLFIERHALRLLSQQRRPGRQTEGLTQAGIGNDIDRRGVGATQIQWRSVRRLMRDGHADSFSGQESHDSSQSLDSPRQQGVQ